MSEPDCTDVCKIVMSRLIELGFDIKPDDKGHKEIIDVLNQTKLVKKEVASMSKESAIIPVRLDSYTGDTSALEVHFFKDSEEYGSKSLPDDSMWIAVHMVNGRIEHALTDYGYRSLEELLEAYKDEKIIQTQPEKATE